MKKALLRLLPLLLAVCAAALTACGSKQPKEDLYDAANVIRLSGSEATLNGTPIPTSDYTWHCDPSVVHDEDKNAPAEYHTGTLPTLDASVGAYIDHDLAYFPELPADGFRLVSYDGEQEYAYYYTDGKNNDFIFATLPNLGNSLPTQMMHSEAEATKNAVLHITAPGAYLLEGEWNGQIRVELGDPDAVFADPDAKVTIILHDADITCTVAPGIVFADAYECDNTWGSRETYSADVDTADAGVTVVIADGTENSVTGTNVFRMLKTKYKDETSADAVKTQKKQRKTDGAFYSYVTMNITGGSENTGKLTVTSGFEGIDSELHLTFLGGNITVNSQDDGVNVNEDNVSVVAFRGGSVTLNSALGAEGDGVDSNGFIVLDGGTLSVNGVTAPDSALDSEDGVYYQSGTVIIDGKEQTYTPGSVFRESGMQGDPGDRPGQPGQPGQQSEFDLAEFKEKVAALPDDATLADVLALLGMGGSFGPGQGGFDPGQGNFGPGQSGEQPPAPPTGGR